MSDLTRPPGGTGAPTAPVQDGRLEAWTVQSLRLEVLDGPDRGACFVPKKERTVVGTHRSADLVLRDPTVSRFHCELALVEGRASIRDLGSRNGTWVGGVRLGEGQLASRQVLTLGKSRLQVELSGEVRIPLAASDRFGRLVGGSPAMRAIYPILESAANCDIAVLLEGETGTGKDVAAQSIHEASRRRDGPLVVVDCGGIPATLIESELFGHERGAFTGATERRLGALELAAAGTLFLDEVGELPLALQPKLLRALERHEVRRLGGDQPIRVDTRVIAATNRDLRREVNQGRFRPDLYYRLAVLPIRLPPLRERLADLPLLVTALLAEEGAPDFALDILQPGSALAELRQQTWPGNVRELRNHLQRCLACSADALAASAMMLDSPLEASVELTLPLRLARQRCVDAFERRYLEELLRRHGGNVRAAAKSAGVDRVHLHRLLAKAKLRGSAG